MKNFFYPLGFFGISFISTIYTQWIVFFYSQQDFGASPWPTVGTILFIGFIVQGLWSPIIGHWSDHSKHILGSKKSIVLMASISMSLTFLFLWRQESHLTLIAMMLMYNILFVSIMQPLLAMLPTIETKPEKRVKLTLIGAVLAIAATIGALVIGAQIKTVYGFIGLGVSGFLVLIISIVIPMFIAKVPQATSNNHDQKFVSHFFKQSFKLLKTKHVSTYIAGNGLTLGICMTLTILIPFIAQDRFAHEPNFTTHINIALSIGMLIAMVLLGILSKRLDMLKLQRSLLLASTVVLTALITYDQYDLSVFTPEVIWLGGFFCLGGIVLGAYVCPPIVLSAKSDALHDSGDGLLFGLNGMVVNIGNAFGSAVTAYLLLESLSSATEDRVISVMFFSIVAAIIAALLIQASIWSNSDR